MRLCRRRMTIYFLSLHKEYVFEDECMPENRMGEQWTLIQLGETLSLRKLRAARGILFLG